MKHNVFLPNHLLLAPLKHLDDCIDTGVNIDTSSAGAYSNTVADLTTRWKSMPCKCMSKQRNAEHQAATTYVREGVH
jgi:hypothetical protein